MPPARPASSRRPPRRAAKRLVRLPRRPLFRTGRLLHWAQDQDVSRRPTGHRVRAARTLQEDVAVIAWLRRLLLTWVTAFLGVTACWLPDAVWARSIEPDSILDPIIWIEHQADLVQTARGSFTVRYLPTSPDQMRRISALCRYRDNERRADGYFVSARRAKRRDYYSVWWRDGVKERQEKTQITRPAIVETKVFDGQLVKTLDSTPGRTCLYLASPDTHWTHMSRVQPFTFAFEYRSSPHGAILRRSPQRRVAWHRFRDRGSCVVTAHHPTDDRLVLRMVFDEQRRLVRRDAILTRSSTFMELDHDEPAVYARWEFSKFRPYDDGNGSQIWFPARAMLRYYLGVLPDGSLVERSTMQIDVRNIEFNVEIPASRFQLDAPQGVPVRDLRDSGYSVLGVSY
jgi:hypothetical protein